MDIAPQVIGQWQGENSDLCAGDDAMVSALRDIHTALYVVSRDGALAAATFGVAELGPKESADGLPLHAYVPACSPETLGDPTFRAEYGVRYAYVAGAMANGIASVELVEAMARAGMLAFFGAAGLAPQRVGDAVDRLQQSLGDIPFGVNLIHSPSESATELAVVDLLLQKKHRLVEASAYLALTLPVVKYRTAGIHRDASGTIIVPNKIIAKISRTEVATRFMSPPPEKFLKKLLESGDITEEQAELAREIPMANDITAESDSGGHTDHRPAMALLPTMCALRDQLQAEHQYAQPLRVGLAGGISTPASAVAAFAMGAAYVMTGSVNQACRESGTSDTVRKMLAETQQADVARAPAADMFEMGVTVQVLKRGTMFSMRGQKLYEIYRAYGSLEEIPQDEREKLEKTVFRASLDDIWAQTHAFFTERDPRQIERAEKKPKHKMALVFRWYLGQGSRWANSGEEGREMDYQIWCGPAMGAFNEWAKGSYLEGPENRHVVTVAHNILYGAAVLTRVNAVRGQGISLPAAAMEVPLQTPEELTKQLG